MTEAPKQFCSADGGVLLLSHFCADPNYALPYSIETLILGVLQPSVAPVPHEMGEGGRKEGADRTGKAKPLRPCGLASFE
jgi:hypothetical protein